MPVDGHDVRARGIGVLRRQVAQELDVELRGRPGLSTANQIIAGVILLSVLLIVVETEPAIFQPYVTVFLWIEFGLLLFFTLEYLLRLWCAVENPKTFSRFTYALRPLIACWRSVTMWSR
jgi:voltage-gated potassium channel